MHGLLFFYPLGRATQEEGFLAIGAGENLDFDIFADAAPIRFVGDFGAKAAQFGTRRADHVTAPGG